MSEQNKTGRSVCCNIFTDIKLAELASKQQNTEVYKTTVEARAWLSILCLNIKPGTEEKALSLMSN